MERRKQSRKTQIGRYAEFWKAKNELDSRSKRTPRNAQVTVANELRQGGARPRTRGFRQRTTQP